MDMDGFDGISAQIAADRVLDDFCHGVTTFRFNHLLPDVLKVSIRSPCREKCKRGS